MSGSARSDRSAKPYSQYLVPAGIYALAYVLCRLLGFDRFEIPWQFWQLLDQRLLGEAPLQSLYLLHAQPPVLNATLALLLKLGELTGIAPEVWARGLFAFLGLASSVLLFRVLIKVVDSWVLATVGLVVTLANPAYHVFQSLYFYPFILSLLLITLLFLSLRLLETANPWYLFASAILLGLVCNTRSLFHPLWAIMVYALLLALLYARHRGRKRLPLASILVSSGLLVALLALWPLKNYLLFGEYTFSTWEGYNLARGTGVESEVLEEYIRSGTVPAAIEEELAHFQRTHGFSGVGVLTEYETTAGGRNWNHYLLTAVNEPLHSQAIEARIQNPERWLRQIRKNYAAWTRASYVQPYLGTIRGPEDGEYIQYASLHRRLLFFDTRPWLEPYFPGFFEALRLKRKPLPLTLFGLVLFPLLMVVSLSMAFWRLRKRQYFGAASILIPWITVAWVLLIPCLTDGSEGNRMRFGVTAYLVVLAAIVLKELAQFINRCLRPLPAARSG